MATHAGMDTKFYPGDTIMQWLKTNTNLEWTGFYLAPAPTHPDASWMPVRSSLAAMGWGMAPIYVGQSADGTLTADQGTADGQNAVSLATSAGFPQGSVIYLDIEEGSPLSQERLDYYAAWVIAVIGQNFTPGVYCSYQTAAQLTSDQGAVVWAWKLGSYNCADVQNGQYPTPDPGDSTVSSAHLWQLIQNCMIPSDALGTPLNVDLSSSDLKDPSNVNSAIIRHDY